MHDDPLGATPLSAAQYNEALNHPTIRTTIRYLARRGGAFDSDALIERLGGLPSYPRIMVGDLLAAAKAARAPLKGAFAEAHELGTLPTPFLTFLKRSDHPNASVDLVQVEQIKRRRVLIGNDRFGEETISRDDLLRRWSGVVVLSDTATTCEAPPALAEYRAGVAVLPGFLSRDECRDLIAYCENACFTRSRVVQRRGTDCDDVVMTQVRSSASVVLFDRNHPVLSRIYARCAQREGVSPHHIEAIQCVRYKRGQKFRPHFDGGVDLPRLTTYLLYLNDDFTGGETYFPMTGQSVAPLEGACLRFPSCDRSGRILWLSEHGGLPVASGVKYALNIWVRCPDAGLIPSKNERIGAGRTASMTAIDAVDRGMAATGYVDVHQ